MGKFMAFSYSVMQITLELCTLLKVSLWAYLELQSMLIDLQQYKPSWIVRDASTTPKELDFTSSATGKWEDELDKLDELVDLDAIHCTETALGKVVLPPKAYFVPSKAVHVQFDGDP